MNQPESRSQYFISLYKEPNVGYTWDVFRDSDLEIHLYLNFYDKYHNDEDFYYSTAEGYNRLKFWDLAVKHGDLYYDTVDCPDRPTLTCNSTRTPETPFVWAKDIDRIDVVSDADWDAEHPAGTSLNDLFTIECRSFYHYIACGYKFLSGYYGGHDELIAGKRLSEIQQGDLWCVLNGDIILADCGLPTKDMIHAFTVTFTTDEQEKIVVNTESIDIKKEIDIYK